MSVLSRKKLSFTQWLLRWLEHVVHRNPATPKYTDQQTCPKCKVGAFRIARATSTNCFRSVIAHSWSGIIGDCSKTVYLKQRAFDRTPPMLSRTGRSSVLCKRVDLCALAGVSIVIRWACSTVIHRKAELYIIYLFKVLKLHNRETHYALLIAKRSKHLSPMVPYHGQFYKTIVRLWANFEVVQYCLWSARGRL